VANEVVGLDVVARLDGFREELAKIPEIGAKEAKQLASQLSRELKAAERAAKQATKASKQQQRAARAGTKAVQKQTAAMKRLTAAVSLGPIIEGAKKLAEAFKAGVERATELDTAAGGTLAASLKELQGEAGGLADSFLIELTPALEASVNWLADVAQGATIAAKALFGLNQQEAQNRAATEAGRAAVNKQADEVERLRGEYESYRDSIIAAGGDPDTNATVLALAAGVERQIEIMKRLQGELEYTGPAAPAAPGAPAGKGKSSKGRRASGPDPAKEAERTAARMVAAYNSIAEAGRDQAAERAGEEAQIRLDADRTREAIEANLALIVESQAATEDQRTAAIAAARQAEVDLEANTAARIKAIHEKSAREEQALILQTSNVQQMSAQDHYSQAAAVAGSLMSMAREVGAADIAAAEGSEAARRRAMKRAWAATTAASIAQAAINVPLAISQGLGSMPFPANIAVAAAGGVAAGAALAGVIAKASQGPKFHRGTGSAAIATGLAPDEFPTVLTKREAVVTAGGVQRLGGPAAIQRANRGESPMGPTQLVFRVGNRTTDVQALEALRRPDSPIAAAIAEGRAAKVGSARIW